ncbi:MAG: ArsR/SmtB family transcription factor [Pseudomonadota bacterium]
MESRNISAALGALAQETRLAIYRRLVEAGPQGLAAGEIAAALDLAAPTLSFHLSQLRQAGLVAQRREGRSLIYAADFAAMNGLIAYLTENCCARSASDRSGAGSAVACGTADCVSAGPAASPSLASRTRRQP